ncbi:MAG: hypothetical protein GY820_25465 [Gammaproteobacteria bacterium]|nr:hypothetical protein [Gammaproteobacteria bacterium]
MGIPASAISIARSQITDIQAYTEFVTYGQQKGESDENFKSRMFTFIKSEYQHERDALIMEQRRDSARKKLLESQPPPVEVVNVELLVRQLERAQSHLTFLWMAIMNTRADKAIELELPIEDGMLTNAELAQLGTLDQQTLFLAPMRFFKPKSDAAGRIKWFM